MGVSTERGSGGQERSISGELMTLGFGAQSPMTGLLLRNLNS